MFATKLFFLIRSSKNEFSPDHDVLRSVNIVTEAYRKYRRLDFFVESQNFDEKESIHARLLAFSV